MPKTPNPEVVKILGNRCTVKDGRANLRRAVSWEIKKLSITGPDQIIGPDDQTPRPIRDDLGSSRPMSGASRPQSGVSQDSLFCVLCKKPFQAHTTTLCSLHVKPVRNQTWMCCNAKLTEPGCCSVQHCSIIRDPTCDNSVLKTSDGKKFMSVKPH